MTETEAHFVFQTNAENAKRFQKAMNNLKNKTNGKKSKKPKSKD